MKSHVRFTVPARLRGGIYGIQLHPLRGEFFAEESLQLINNNNNNYNNNNYYYYYYYYYYHYQFRGSHFRSICIENQPDRRE